MNNIYEVELRMLRANDHRILEYTDAPASFYVNCEKIYAHRHKMEREEGIDYGSLDHYYYVEVITGIRIPAIKVNQSGNSYSNIPDWRNNPFGAFTNLEMDSLNTNLINNDSTKLRSFAEYMGKNTNERMKHILEEFQLSANATLKEYLTSGYKTDAEKVKGLTEELSKKYGL